MNAKRIGIISLGLAGLTLTARHFYGIYRGNKEFDDMMADLELEEALYEAELADYEYSAHYSVNDPVIVRNPYVADDWPEHGVVEQIVRISDTGAFTYKVTGQDGWLNENWLVYDDYGPMKLAVVPVKPAKIKEPHTVAINYWLDERKDAEEKGDEARFIHAESELKEIAVKMSGVNADD